VVAEQTLRLVLETPWGASSELLGSDDGNNCEATGCSGLILAIVAKCAVWDAASRSHVLLSLLAEDGRMVQGEDLRRGLLTLARAVVRGIAATQVEESVSEELRHGVSLLVRHLCVSWPTAMLDSNEDDLWGPELVPLVMEWLERLTPPLTPSRFLTNESTAHADSWAMQLCSTVSRERRENLVERLSRRAAVLASRGAEGGESVLPPLLGIVRFLSAVLRGLPQAPSLHTGVAGEVAVLIHCLLALGALGPSAPVFQGVLGPFVAFYLSIAELARGLFSLLAAPMLRGAQAKREPHRKLAEAELLILQVAELLARLALKFSRGVCSSPGVFLEPSHFGELVASSYALMSTLFSVVPPDGARLLGWTRKPHIVVEVLKVLLEAAYAAPDGARAAAAAGDVTRLWEAYTQGGTRLVAQSAGRSGQSTYQAKVQRATKGFVIMLVAHALEQQRQSAGIEAATQKSLRRLPPHMRAGSRSAEVAMWKEAVDTLQLGLTPLLVSLEGSEHLKQSLYVGLREPLNSMFKDMHENYQVRGRYQGSA